MLCPMNKIVKCPTCKIAVEWSKDAEYRPFCSKRCRLIDLGEWASEGHAIPASNLDQEIEISDKQFTYDESQY